MHVRLLKPVAILVAFGGLVVARLRGMSAASTPVTVSPDVTKAVVVIKSDVGMSQKSRALERLKEKGTADAISELVKLTEHSDARISTAVCAATTRAVSSNTSGSRGSRIEHRHAVQDRKPRAGGSHDMHGNAGEWCANKFAFHRELPAEFVEVAQPSYCVWLGGSSILPAPPLARRGETEKGSTSSAVTGFDWLLACLTNGARRVRSGGSRRVTLSRVDRCVRTARAGRGKETSRSRARRGRGQ